MRHALPLGALVVALSCCAGRLSAAPEATHLFPAGGQRGQRVAVALGGKLPAWPAQFWVDRPGLHIHPLEKSGEVEVKIEPDATPGVRWIRIYDASGSAAPLAFVVGTIREASEIEPNDELTSAQSCESIADGLLVNGRLAQPGDVDVFAASAQAGQTLVADIDAQTPLGSPVDCVLQLVSPEGFVTAQAEDQQGLDPRLVARIDRDGEWRIRVLGFPATPNQTIGLAGGETYVYRLTLTTGPYADFSLPLAVKRGAASSVALRGWNLPTELASMVVPAGDGSALLQHPALANTLELPTTPHDSVTLEGAEAMAPREVVLPVTLTGVLNQPGQRDRVKFAVKQGETFAARIESRALGFDLDPVLELFDSSDKLLARVDDSPGTRDARLTHAATADGIVTLAISDLHRSSGPRFAYRLELARALPEYRVACGVHEAVLARGGTVEIPLTIERLDGHAEAIKLVAEGLPAGVSCPPVESVADGDSAAKVVLQLTSGADAPLASAPIRIRADDARGNTQLARVPARSSEAPLVDLWLTLRDGAAE